MLFYPARDISFEHGKRYDVNYFQLFKANTRILTFGALMVFFSSFGQTFVVSLYIPSFVEHFDITSGFFSGMYGVATLLSAATLIFVGKKIDFVPLRRFALFVVLGVIAACLITAFSWHLAVLFLGVYSLRFFGQGLCMHTAATTMSRYFVKVRGKALSISFLGFPLGEAVFPVLVATGIGILGWRETLGVSAVLVAVVLLPLTIFLLHGLSRDKINEGAGEEEKKEALTKEAEGKIWKQQEVIRTPWFYLFAPTVFLVGFMQTALFFFQTYIADFKGWSTEWMAGSIVGYAITSSLTSLLVGPLIDKYSARRIFPFILLPLACGILLLSLSTNPLITPFYWLLVGITGGLNSPVMSALYAETYGTRSVGTVRSLFIFVMVVSTALGPVVYSFFLGEGFSFDQIHFGAIGVILLNMLFILWYNITRR